MTHLRGLLLRTVLAGLACGWASCLAASRGNVSLVIDGPVGPPAQHGLDVLKSALSAHGWAVESATSLESASGQIIVLAGRSSVEGAASRTLRELGATPPAAAEGLVIRKTSWKGKPTLVFCGTDDRGLMYAALDTAERVGWTSEAREALANPQPAVSDAPRTETTDPFSEVQDLQEQPYVRERSLSVYTMNRAYWESRFYDEAYWKRYFDLLAASRFNKFFIVFGYENGGFLAPPYPYFLETPGFPGVHMADLTPEAKQKNRAALNRLIELAHERGLEVAVGIWDHIYRAGVQTGGIEWANEYQDHPVPGTVQGVTTENLNAYTLASLKEFLTAFPGLDEVQFRIHEESGLRREEMDAFWGEVFRMARSVRPKMLFEARAKGTPDSVINTALLLGVNLRVETKYWMEQMGLSFHPTHVNPEDQRNRRHGYADLLRYPKRYDLNWRLWNGGTARVLLWADPEYVRRYSASTMLYDSPIWDVNEPLATKMEAQRPGVKPFELMPAKYRYYDYEFERYWHFFQVWGRLGYNPQASPRLWKEEFARRFGAAAAPHIEAGLHRASQVLPYLVAAVYPYSLFPTTRGWAERQSLGATLPNYAGNTGTDVAQFESFKEAAARILAGGTTARRTPLATSRWLDHTADDVLREIAAAEQAAGANRGNEFESTLVDLRILASLARFHARRAVAAVNYQLFKATHDLKKLDAAIEGEQAAIAAWRTIVDVAGDRYNFDLAMGARRFDLCGHWRDELKKLDQGFAQLQQERRTALDAKTVPSAIPGAVTENHDPPKVSGERVPSATPLQPLQIKVTATDPSGIASVRLRYRHLTQFEDYLDLEMKPNSEPNSYAATVPGEFIVPRWDLIYYVEVIAKNGQGVIWPSFEKELPYVVVKLQR